MKKYIRFISCDSECICEIESLKFVKYNESLLILNINDEYYYKKDTFGYVMGKITWFLENLHCTEAGSVFDLEGAIEESEKIISDQRKALEEAKNL